MSKQDVYYDKIYDKIVIVKDFSVIYQLLYHTKEGIESNDADGLVERDAIEDALKRNDFTYLGEL